MTTNTRVVAGNAPGEVDLPIAEAIAASAAIPGVFPPRRIDLGGRTVLGVDGGTGGYRIGVRDLADVDLVIAYNHAGFAPHEGRIEHVSAPAVIGMSLQLAVNQSNIDEIASWMDAHPEAHAWVFQPPPRELSSTLSYAQIFGGARECYALAQRWLREHFDYFGTVLANHGVRVDPGFDRVRFDDVVALGSGVKPG
jgi:NTE family protein